VGWAPVLFSPELEREYARRGIGLIDPDAGVESLFAELQHGAPGDAQVILMSGEPRAEVAIIGMAAVFPGAANLDAYWQNIAGGVDAITEVHAGPAGIRLFYDPAATAPDRFYCPVCGVFVDAHAVLRSGVVRDHARSPSRLAPSRSAASLLHVAARCARRYAGFTVPGGPRGAPLYETVA